jgi:hypothetical protein
MPELQRSFLHRRRDADLSSVDERHTRIISLNIVFASSRPSLPPMEAVLYRSKNGSCRSFASVPCLRLRYKVAPTQSARNPPFLRTSLGPAADICPTIRLTRSLPAVAGSSDWCEMHPTKHVSRRNTSGAARVGCAQGQHRMCSVVFEEARICGPQFYLVFFAMICWPLERNT